MEAVLLEGDFQKTKVQQFKIARMRYVHHVLYLDHLMHLQVSYRSSGDTVQGISRSTLTQHQNFRKPKQLLTNYPLLHQK